MRVPSTSWKASISPSSAGTSSSPGGAGATSTSPTGSPGSPREVGGRPGRSPPLSTTGRTPQYTSWSTSRRARGSASSLWPEGTGGHDEPEVGGSQGQVEDGSRGDPSFGVRGGRDPERDRQSLRRDPPLRW